MKIPQIFKDSTCFLVAEWEISRQIIAHVKTLRNLDPSRGDKLAHKLLKDTLALIDEFRTVDGVKPLYKGYSNMGEMCLHHLRDIRANVGSDEAYRIVFEIKKAVDLFMDDEKHVPDNN